MTVFYLLFVLSALYAIAGDVAVRIMLTRRNIQTSFWLRGVPGYLYRICTRDPSVSPRWRRFAYSTNVAFVICFLSVLAIVATEEESSMQELQR